jgi:hypothetical protein
MKAIFPAVTAPPLIWRMAMVLGLWFLIFGAITVMTPPPPMEGGYDASQEQLKAILCSPMLMWMGLASMLGRHMPSLLALILSFGIIFGPTAFMLFRCHTRRAFWIWTGVQVIIITVSSIGFTQLARCWSENP